MYFTTGNLSRVRCVRIPRNGYFCLNTTSNLFSSIIPESFFVVGAGNIILVPRRPILDYGSVTTIFIAELLFREISPDDYLV